MSVRVRDGFFHLDFRFRGKRYRLSTGIARDRTDKKFKETEKFVNDWDATIRREIAMRTFVLENHFPQFGQSAAKPVLETFRETAEKWLKSHRNSWAEWTYRKYRDALRSRIYPKIGDRPTAGLKAIDVRLLREQIIEDGKIKGGKLSNRRVNRIMSPVTGILNELFEDGELALNPVARLSKLKEKRVAEIHPFEDDELKILYRTARKHFRWYADYVQYLFESGFRLEENNGLKWSQVNESAKIISIREAMALRRMKDPKTESAARDVEITLGMNECLIRQKARSYLKRGFVWVTQTGRPIDVSNFRADIWVPLLEKAGLDYRYPNQARHTFATKHIIAGFDPRWIANQMGTSLEMLFETYTAAFRVRGHVDGHASKKGTGES